MVVVADERAEVEERSADAEFEDWYRSTYEATVRTLAVVVGDVDVAAEAVAEAFSRALGRSGEVTQMGNRDGWIYRTALNVARRRHRRRALEDRLLRRHRSREGFEPDLPDPRVWAAVRDLPDRQRQAIALRYVADLPEREVAAAMGVAEGTASATLAAARRRLAAILEET